MNERAKSKTIRPIWHFYAKIDKIINHCNCIFLLTWRRWPDFTHLLWWFQMSTSFFKSSFWSPRTWVWELKRAFEKEARLSQLKTPHYIVGFTKRNVLCLVIFYVHFAEHKNNKHAYTMRANWCSICFVIYLL